MVDGLSLENKHNIYRRHATAVLFVIPNPREGASATGSSSKRNIKGPMVIQQLVRHSVIWRYKEVRYPSIC